MFKNYLIGYLHIEFLNLSRSKHRLSNLIALATTFLIWIFLAVALLILGYYINKLRHPSPEGLLELKIIIFLLFDLIIKVFFYKESLVNFKKYWNLGFPIKQSSQYTIFSSLSSISLIFLIILLPAILVAELHIYQKIIMSLLLGLISILNSYLSLLASLVDKFLFNSVFVFKASLVLLSASVIYYCPIPELNKIIYNGLIFFPLFYLFGLLLVVITLNMVILNYIISNRYKLFS